MFDKIIDIVTNVVENIKEIASEKEAFIIPSQPETAPAQQEVFTETVDLDFDDNGQTDMTVTIIGDEQDDVAFIAWQLQIMDQYYQPFDDLMQQYADEEERENGVTIYVSNDPPQDKRTITQASARGETNEIYVRDYYLESWQSAMSGQTPWQPEDGRIKYITFERTYIFSPFAEVLAHEFGHAIGDEHFSHTTDEGNANIDKLEEDMWQAIQDHSAAVAAE